MSRCKVILEIGTAKGGTLYLWSRIAPPGALIISIDMPGEVGSVGKSVRKVYESFGSEKGIQVVTIPADSHSREAHENLRAVLGGRKVDYLFIDGDHRYEGVKRDFTDCQAYMAPQGIVAFHDVTVTDSEIGVGRFWSEMLAQPFKTRTLHSKPGVSTGIGIVFLP